MIGQILPSALRDENALIIKVMTFLFSIKLKVWILVPKNLIQKNTTSNLKKVIINDKARRPTANVITFDLHFNYNVVFLN